MDSDHLLQIATIKELKSKIPESIKELEKLDLEVAEYKNLPLLNKSLQSRVQALAKALFILEATLSRTKTDASAEKEDLVWKEDLQAMAAHKDDNKPSA